MGVSPSELGVSAPFDSRVIALPTLVREKGISPTLRFYPNGLIDLEPISRLSPDRTHINGLEYEEHGMREVDKMIPDEHFAIGAHLLDAATVRTDLERGGNGRPDVMEFDWAGNLVRM